MIFDLLKSYGYQVGRVSNYENMFIAAVDSECSVYNTTSGIEFSRRLFSLILIHRALRF